MKQEQLTGGWHSWDPAPWAHPWLSTANLTSVREFSRQVLDRDAAALEEVDPKKLSVGFVGNIANAMYTRAVPLRAAGMQVSLYLHPHDRYAMSFPGWEEADRAIEDGETDIEALRARGFDLLSTEGVHRLPGVQDWPGRYGPEATGFVRPEDKKLFDSYLYLMDSLVAMQSCDVLWGTQYAYLAYLANRPYVVSQSGGDIWFEAARDDVLGRLMRRAFARARMWLVSNPWSFAHARRYGLHNLVYLPRILDETVYAPRHGRSRGEWLSRVGGEFFVFTSSRLDERNKASGIGLRGFAQFCRQYPAARLAVIGWGKDRRQAEAWLTDLGLRDKVMLLPLSTKARIRDYLNSADAFLDQFVLGYFGSAGLEAMACGVPLIGRLELSQYGSLCDTGAPPALVAETPEQVCLHLLNLAQSAEYRARLSEETRDWFLRNHGSQHRLRDYQAVLAATARQNPIDWSQSPLLAPLHELEKSHHCEGLRAAPTYPNYGW